MISDNKLSIIIPCFNCEDTLSEAVFSIYEQKIDIPFEIIMVDDRSTDNTVNLMRGLANKYPEIKLFYHQENKGGGSTRNTAVQNSEGNIIFCLDSDDLLPPNTLPKMYKYLLEKKCDGVGFSASIKFNGKNKDDISYVHNFKYINQKIPIKSLLEPGACSLYSVFMFTKRSFEIIGGYPTNHGFDTQGFAFRFLLNGLNAYTCPNTEYKQRINDGESYYLREYNSGRENHNWYKILCEFLSFFSKEAQETILNFKLCSTEKLIEKIESLKEPFVEISAIKTHERVSETIIYVSKILNRNEKQINKNISIYYKKNLFCSKLFVIKRILNKIKKI